MLVPGRYQLGCIVGFEMPFEGVGLITHVGILGDRIDTRDGLPSVIHSSKLYRCVLEMPLRGFVERAVTPARSLGYPGRLSEGEVLARARSRIGQEWSPFRNCEHFVTWCHGLEPSSPQLRALLIPR